MQSQLRAMALTIGFMISILLSKTYPKRPCEICSSSVSNLLFRQSFAELSFGSLMSGYDVVICDQCGFGFADRIPDQDTFDCHYKEMSKYEFQENDGNVSEFDHERFQSIVDFLLSYLPNRCARILDVGCATGSLLSRFKEVGYENVIGIDPSPVCADTAERLYGVKVYNVSIKNIVQHVERFDLVVLSGVLEHIKDLNSFLADLQSLLAEDGLLFVEVPDASEFANCPDAPYQEFSTEHINFFSERSLCNLLCRHNFEPVFVKKFDRMQSFNTTMPVVSVVCKRCTSPEKSAFVKDTATEAGLRKYIWRSQRIENSIHTTINRLVDEGLPIIVWGVGTHTLRLFETSRLRDANIHAFVDSNPRFHNKLLENIPIVGPDELHSKKETILISSRVFQDEIEKQIRTKLMLTNSIIKLYSSVG